MSDRAFVFACLPGAVEPVLVGQIIVAETGNTGFCRFKYADTWLDRPEAFALDPVLLPLEARDFFESQPGWEVFSALRDAGPDYWGRKVIEHRERRVGLTELEYLLATGDQRAGALAFAIDQTPAATRSSAPSAIRLPDLLEAVAHLERDEPVPAHLLALLGDGSGTLGGMRPKAVVERDGNLWVAKFPAKDDRTAVTRWEYATLSLAARCGIRVPRHEQVEVNGRNVLLTERFDRRRQVDGFARAHLLSGLTMLGLHERDYGEGSYTGLATWLRIHGSRPRDDMRELFLRMVFNIITGNTDDHLRNHVVVDFGEGYRLSPAFDLLPQSTAGADRRQAIGVGADGRAATLGNALTHAGLFGLEQAEGAALISETRRTIAANWQDIYALAGINRRELNAIGKLITPFLP